MAATVIRNFIAKALFKKNQNRGIGFSVCNLSMKSTRRRSTASGVARANFAAEIEKFAGCFSLVLRPIRERRSRSQAFVLSLTTAFISDTRALRSRANAVPDARANAR